MVENIGRFSDPSVYHRSLVLYGSRFRNLRVLYLVLPWDDLRLRLKRRFGSKLRSAQRIDILQNSSLVTAHTACF